MTFLSANQIAYIFRANDNILYFKYNFTSIKSVVLKSPFKRLSKTCFTVFYSILMDTRYSNKFGVF